jgi:hypothetical protein
MRIGSFDLGDRQDRAEDGPAQLRGETVRSGLIYN